MKIEAILTPAEFSSLAKSDLRATACVVFDILRATSTFVTALQHGAKEIIPVCEISEAVARRTRQPEVLLAGERDGVRIKASESGGTDFDLGNSPLEFTPDKIGGRTIVSTTTNGTRALRACASAQKVLAAAFLNLAATAEFLQRERFEEVLLVCAGTGEQAALEDALAAGALAELLTAREADSSECSDSAEMVRRTFLQAQPDLWAAFSSSQNARRLLAIPDLNRDVVFCLQRDIFGVVAAMSPDGAIRRL
jgi:2-phosphosulfolactate phosphatase